MTEENYNHRTSQIMLRNQFPGDGRWSIPKIPKFQEKPGDFDDLLLIGFDKANVTAAAANGVRVLLSGLPALLAVGCVVFCMLCPMSEKRVAQIQSDIEAREAAESK